MSVHAKHTPEMVSVSCPVCDTGATRFEREVGGYRLERCLGCKLVFQNPRYSADSLDEIYVERDTEELIELYARIATPTVLSEYATKLDQLERLAPDKGRLLDYACAAGYFLELAQTRGWDAHGVDIGAWCAEAAKRRGVGNLHIGHLQELAFPDHHFDVVYAAQVFEHLPDPRVDLAEIRRILRPGGLLYVDVPNYQCLSILVGRDKFDLNEPPQHVNFFTPRTLKGLIELSGFSIERVSTEGGVKWEDIVGVKLRSEILDAYETKDSPPSASQEKPGSSQRSIARRLLHPVYSLVFYQWAKVGMNLTLLARRPAS